MTDNQTDWQELCAQLHKALEAHSTTWDDDVLLDRVWVALRAAESRHKRKRPTQAEPEPEGLTDEALPASTDNQTNWQELCAHLYVALAAHSTWDDDDVLLDRAHVALQAAESKPERKLPTRDEAVALYTEVMIANDCQTLGDMAETFSHAVLARWGQ